MVYGTFEAYPLSIDIQIRIISFWTKLSDSGNNDTAILINIILRSLNKQRKLKSTWLENIKILICSNEYSDIWQAHENVNGK